LNPPHEDHFSSLVLQPEVTTVIGSLPIVKKIDQ
jgi:hypothetical protein